MYFYTSFAVIAMAAMKKKKKWTTEDLAKALDDIQENKLSYREAEAKYGIPKSTLCDYKVGKVEVGAQTGPTPILTAAEEQKLVDYAFEMSKIGYGQTKQQILTMVQKILKKDGRLNPFKDDRPGKKWWQLFLKRHPEVTLRVPELLQQARAQACNAEKISLWFSDFDQFLITHDLKDKACSIWNADESGFSLCPKSGKVVAPVGCRAVYGIASNSKEQITTLCAISAAGNVIPPMHIFPGERFRGYNPMQNCTEGAYFGRSPKGWISTELFYGWLANHFSRHVSERPVVLLVDGHTCHIDIEVSKLCQTNKMHLYCLPPHTSHMTQPLDVGFFKPLKVAWSKACESFKLDHPGYFVDKKVFAEVFKRAWIESTKMSNIVSAFKAAGICPLNPSAIHLDKAGPSIPYLKSAVASVSHSKSDQRDGSTMKASLKAVEDLMGHDKVKLFYSRFEEGYDVQEDEMYVLWSKLKSLTISEPQVSAAPPDTAPPEDSPKEILLPKSQQEVTPVMDEILTYPNPSSKPKKVGGVSAMPKHLSGDQVIRFLEERKQKKLQEEEEKLKRKAEREAKKKQREEEAKRKQLERVARGRGRRGKGRGRMESQVQWSDSSHATRSASSSSATPRFEMQSSSDESNCALCPVCKSSENAVWPWVACDTCETWYHAECTDLDPDVYPDLDVTDWVCLQCQ